LWTKISGLSPATASFSWELAARELAASLNRSTKRGGSGSSRHDAGTKTASSPTSNSGNSSSICRLSSISRTGSWTAANAARSSDLSTGAGVGELAPPQPVATTIKARAKSRRTIRIMTRVMRSFKSRAPRKWGMAIVATDREGLGSTWLEFAESVPESLDKAVAPGVITWRFLGLDSPYECFPGFAIGK
jgi:hypothetical protein